MGIGGILYTPTVLSVPVGVQLDPDQEALCPPFGPDRPALSPRPPEAPTHAEADHVRYGQNGSIELQGDARIQRPKDRITADQLNYQKLPQERISGQGDLWYETAGFTVHADKGWLLPNSHQGELSNVRYWLNAMRASGKADSVRQQDANRYQLSEASYSTCPPQHRSWDITAQRINLDRDSGRGQAYEAVLHAGDVPVFYLPYFNFPIDDRRQSGLLYPTFGSSTAGGFELAVPYYWNIAPNMDATLTPHVFTRRGLGLNAQWRYLHHMGSGTGRDQLDLFWLPHDRVYGGKRWSVAFTDKAQVNDQLGYDLSIQRVSDKQFFQDFSDNLDQAATDNLPSRFNLHANAGGWSLGLMALSYQTVNPLISESNYPYRIMPRVTLGRSGLLGTTDRYLGDWHLRADATRFDHPFSGATTGQRVHIDTGVDHRWAGSWYEVTPKLTFDGTYYQLQRGTNDPLYNATDPKTHPSRALPITSIDSKLFFERPYGSDGRYIAQLEPRLYYLYVPYRDQSDIPLFDTGLATISYNQLFSPNRFTGGDRISDANALSYGVSWSLVDTLQGTEPLSLRLAQQYRFTNSRVPPVVGKGGSTMIAEVHSDLTRHWSGSVAAEYDTQNGQIGRTQTRFGYRGDDGSAVNLAYFTKPTDNTEGYRQAEFSFAWNATRRWSVLGKVGYAFDQDKVVQSLLGVGYTSCCWATRVAVKRYVVNPTSILTGGEVRYANAIVFEVELKGLGTFGQKNRLEQDILGYQP